MNIIVAVDKNWGIGYKGNLLTHLPEDLKFFKEKTSDKIVVMGRKTLESLPNGKPLANRINIVLTKDKSYECDGTVICYSFEELYKTINKYDSDDVFIIGGAQIYNLLLNKCKKAYITKIYKEFNADTYLDNIDKLEQWNLINKSEIKDYNNIYYSFCEYIHK